MNILGQSLRPCTFRQKYLTKQEFGKSQISNNKSQTNIQCPNDQNKKKEPNGLDTGFDIAIL